MLNSVQAVSTVRTKSRERSPAAGIVSDLRAEGLIPFRVTLSVEEAIPLACYLRDVQTAWGSSGALAPPDLQSEPCFAPKSKARQPRIPTEAMERVQRARARMRAHELRMFQWLEESRKKSNVTLAMAGAEWFPFRYSLEKQNAAAATGLLSAACRTLAEVYTIPHYHQRYPPS